MDRLGSYLPPPACHQRTDPANSEIDKLKEKIANDNNNATNSSEGRRRNADGGLLTQSSGEMFSSRAVKIALDSASGDGRL